MNWSDEDQFPPIEGNSSDGMWWLFVVIIAAIFVALVLL